MSAQTVRAMLAAEIEVRTINGVYQEALATVALSGRNRYELRVQNTHPAMLEFDIEGGHQAVTLSRWESGRGYPVEIPPQLHQKIREMRCAATLSNDMVLQQRDAMVNAIRHTYDELGITRYRSQRECN
jgi:hypothetical protein